MTSRRRTDIIIVAAAAMLGALVPSAAALHLERLVESRVESRLSAALGTPVAVDGLEAGITGELFVYGLSVGEFLSAERVAVLADVNGALTGDARVAEVRFERTRVRLRADAYGRTEADAVRTHLAQYLASRPRASRPSARGAQSPIRLSVVDAHVSVEMADTGRLTIPALSLSQRGGLARAWAKTASFSVERGGFATRGTLRRLAADVDLYEAQVARFVAVDGRLEAGALGETPVRLDGVSMLAGTDQIGPGAGLQLSAQIADSRADVGQLTVRVSGTRAHPRVSASGSEVPLAWLQPLLPGGIRSHAGRFTGTVELARAANRQAALAVRVDADLTGLEIDDRRVASAAFPLSGHARLQATWLAGGGGSRAAGRRLIVDDMSLSTAGVTVIGRLSADYVDADTWLPSVATVELRLPATACASTLAAVPAPFRSRLDGLDLSGSVSARVKVELIRERPVDTELELHVAERGCRVLRDSMRADPRALLAVSEHRFPDSSRRLVGPGQGDYVELATVPRHLIDAYVASEDARFYRHRGFDSRQIKRSLIADLRARAFVRGGSTISQQLVKNAFLSPERTLARKFQEAVLTWRVETVASKRQILERYLNIIELGPGIFGIEAAAQYWFGKNASELTVLESAFMVTLTPAPSTISRRVRTAGGTDAKTRQRMETVLSIMRRHRVIDEATYRRALAQRLTWRAGRVAALQ